MAERRLRFEDFYRTQRAPLLSAPWCSPSGTPTWASRAADEALVRAYERWTDVSAMANPKGWVYRVAVNVGYKRNRRRALERRRPIPPDRETRRARGGQATRRSTRALAALPFEQREVIVLRFHLDWTIDEDRRGARLPERHREEPAASQPATTGDEAGGAVMSTPPDMRAMTGCESTSPPGCGASTSPRPEPGSPLARAVEGLPVESRGVDAVSIGPPAPPATATPPPLLPRPPWSSWSSQQWPGWCSPVATGDRRQHRPRHGPRTTPAAGAAGIVHDHHPASARHHLAVSCWVPTAWPAVGPARPGRAPARRPAGRRRRRLHDRPPRRAVADGRRPGGRRARAPGTTPSRWTSACPTDASTTGSASGGGLPVWPIPPVARRGRRSERPGVCSRPRSRWPPVGGAGTVSDRDTGRACGPRRGRHARDGRRRRTGRRSLGVPPAVAGDRRRGLRPARRGLGGGADRSSPGSWPTRAVPTGVPPLRHLRTVATSNGDGRMEVADATRTTPRAPTSSSTRWRPTARGTRCWRGLRSLSGALPAAQPLSPAGGRRRPCEPARP